MSQDEQREADHGLRAVDVLRALVVEAGQRVGLGLVGRVACHGQQPSSRLVSRRSKNAAPEPTAMTAPMMMIPMLKLQAWPM